MAPVSRRIPFNFSDNLLKLKVNEKKAGIVQKDLDICHLNVKPSGVTAFSYLLQYPIEMFSKWQIRGLMVLGSF